MNSVQFPHHFKQEKALQFLNSKLQIFLQSNSQRYNEKSAGIEFQCTMQFRIRHLYGNSFHVFNLCRFLCAFLVNDIMGLMLVFWHRRPWIFHYACKMSSFYFEQITYKPVSCFVYFQIN